MSAAWSYNDKPAGFRVEVAGLDEPTRVEVEDLVWAAVLSGNSEPEPVIEHLVDSYELDDGCAESAFAAAVTARRTQQAGWSDDETTTNLDRAFTELHEAGILALQNFACCTNCGHTEAPDARDDSRAWSGYVFFHEQDTERLIEGDDTIHLGYGAFPAGPARAGLFRRRVIEEPQPVGDEEMVAVGRRAVPILERHGLTVAWDENPDQKIVVGNAQWYAPLEPDE